MNMFARFDENPAMTLEDIKETKRYGRMDARTHGQCEKICGGYNENFKYSYPLSGSNIKPPSFRCLVF